MTFMEKVPFSAENSSVDPVVFGLAPADATRLSEVLLDGIRIQRGRRNRGEKVGTLTTDRERKPVGADVRHLDNFVRVHPCRKGELRHFAIQRLRLHGRIKHIGTARLQTGHGHRSLFIHGTGVLVEKRCGVGLLYPSFCVRFTT